MGLPLMHRHKKCISMYSISKGIEYKMTIARRSASETITTLRHARAHGLTVDVSDFPHNVDVLTHLQTAAAMDGWRRGQAPKFWKSGGPSLDRPLFHAPLPAEGVWLHTPQQPPVRMAQPVCSLHGVEAEIALRIDQTLDQQQVLALDSDSVHSVVGAMTVSIEWVDSRWTQQLQSPLAMLQIDRLSHGGLVVADMWQPYAPRDWSSQICRVELGGGEAHVSQGSHPLGDPSHVLLPWLLHATQHWGVVEAGTIVTTGSWCQILHALPGQTVRVAFDAIGEVNMQFAEAS